MNLMIKWLLVISMIIIVLSILILSISKKAILDTQKSTPFECGFNPMSYTRLPFSIHFFMIAVIFLIFDIEIIMIMPMIITVKTTNIMYWMPTCIMFIVILMIGIFHEWNNGMIQWTK
uniref:NADH dehydrogenase subunit 3 n=1 Tax=Exitianus nanus TaxID=1401695 RepID=UPI0021D527CA|nr:NADH dehydrogenase subunit 3 [Exitianus nanus]UXD78658.1 NADH dehydrogenase subunit 3 [Exitianus nanus]